MGINKDFIIKNGLQVNTDSLIVDANTGNVNITGALTVNGAPISANGGNADTATTLETSRTLTIGSTGKSFDGSADVSWSLGEIGINDSTLTLSTSGIASGSQTFTSNQGTNATFTVDVPATNLTYTAATTTGTVNSSTGTNATIPAATTSLAGLMTNADKTKLNGIEAGAQVNTVTSVANKTGAVTLTNADVGLGNVTNHAQVRKLASSTNGNVPTWSGTAGNELANGYGVETTLTGGSNNLARADAIKTYVDNILASNDAMIFKGTLGTGGTFTSLPTTHDVGWTIKVITAGTYAGQVAEIGDMYVSLVSRAGAGNTNADWAVIQTNIDGAVTGPASSVDNHVALFNGTTGKIIKSAGTVLGAGTLTLATSGIATGSQTFGANQNTNATFTVNVPGTNLAMGGSGNSRTITSSTGTNVSVPVVTTSNAGFMSTGDKTKLDGIAAGAQANVATNLTYTAAATNGTVNSSTGTNATIPAVTTTLAGLMTNADKTKLDGIADGAQVNVGTNLGSSGTGGTRTITSSTGNNTSITYTAADLGAVPTGRTLTAGDGLSGGGNLTANRSFAVDSSVVRTSGNQTIGGIKTFSSDASINGLTIGRGPGSVSSNTTVGLLALADNTTGSSNTAVGLLALRRNTTGRSNTAVGVSALTDNTTGRNNIAVGSSALRRNTTGENNIAVGLLALDRNTTGIQNTAVGGFALDRNTTGASNIAVGLLALRDSTTGNNNIGIGVSAGRSLSPFTITDQNNRIVMGNNNHTDAYIRIAWTVTSDARDKTELAPIPHGLNFVNSLQPTEYQFKAGGRDGEADGIRRYGFLAQDVLALEGEYPVIADAEDPENLKLHESYIVPVLVNAIKELTAEVNALKEK